MPRHTSWPAAFLRVVTSPCKAFLGDGAASLIPPRGTGQLFSLRLSVLLQERHSSSKTVSRFVLPNDPTLSVALRYGILSVDGQDFP